MIKKVFPILALSIFSSMLGSGIIAPLLPLYADSLGASGVWLGTIFAGFAISNAISTPIFGRLSDRHGRKRFISTGLFLHGIISLGFIWAFSVNQLSLIRFAQGIAGGMIIPIARAYIGDLSPKGEEGKWMGYSNAAFFTGFGFGPLLGGVLTEQFGMNTAFLTMSSLNLLAFIIAVIFLPSIATRKPTVGNGIFFKKMISSAVIKGLFTFRLTFSIGRMGFNVFLPLYAAMIGITPALIGVLLAAHMLLSSLLGIPAGKIADRFSRRALVIIGTLIGVIYIAMVPQAQNFWQLLWLSIFGSLSAAISLPAGLAMSVEEGRKFGMGSTLAVFGIAFSLGMAIGPVLAGAIVDLSSITMAFYFGAAVLLAGASSFAWLTRQSECLSGLLSNR